MDTLTFGTTKLENFTFGVARRAPAGNLPIVGLGLDQLQASVIYDGLPSVPGILDRMVQAGVIDRRVFSMYPNSQESGNGTVLFGGIDHSKYTGKLTTLPIAKNNGSYDRYRLDLTSITFTSDNGNITDFSTPNMASPVILDSGVTTLVLPPSIVSANRHWSRRRARTWRPGMFRRLRVPQQYRQSDRAVLRLNRSGIRYPCHCSAW